MGHKLVGEESEVILLALRSAVMVRESKVVVIMLWVGVYSGSNLVSLCWISTLYILNMVLMLLYSV